MAKLDSESYDSSLKLHKLIYCLDNEDYFFLSEFKNETGDIESFPIDVESACDSHYEMDYQNATKLAKFLGRPSDTTEELADALTEFNRKYDENITLGLMQQT